MVKKVRSDPKPFSMQKHNHVCVKFAVSFLLVGLAFRLLLWDSFNFSSSVVETVVETPPPPAVAKEKTDSPVFSLPLEASDHVDFPANNQSQASPYGKGIFLLCACVNRLFIRIGGMHEHHTVI